MKKKILSIILAATLCFGASLTAFADDSAPAQTTKLTTEQAAKVQHKYEIYQILTGTKETVTKADGTTETVLVNYKLGDSLDAATQPKGLWEKIKRDGFKVYDSQKKEITDFDKATLDDIARAVNANYADSTTVGVGAENLATYFAGLTLSNAVTETVSNDKLEVTGLAAGWYLLVDVTPSLDNDDLRMYMDRPQLQFTLNGTVKVVKKRSTIWIDKEVADKNDSLDSATVIGAYGGSADYDVNDDVPFQIKSVVPEDLSKYSSYTYKIKDRQDAGLDAPKIVSLTVNGVDYTDYNITTVNLDKGAKDNDFVIDFGDIKAKGFADGAEIVVNYTSRLNEDAVKGAKGNENEAQVTFNPNDEGDGNTPWDTVIVFTYEPTVNKFDQSGASLDGAKFSLHKLAATYDAVNKNYTITKDANGDEVEVYNKPFVTPHDKDANNADDHTFSIAGIDDGVYKIVEDDAPEGYNAIKPVYFVVVANHDNGKLTALDIYDLDGNAICVADVLTGAIKASAETGKITTDIINQQGVVLPSTGGIGTTIFYVVGGVLVAAAVVLLVVRRRMRTEEE